MPNTFFRWAPTTGCGPFKSLVSVKSWVSKQLPPSKVYRGKLQQLIKLGLLKWSCIEPTRKNISPEISKIFQYIYLYVHDLFMLNIIHVFQCSLKAVYISSSISQIRCFTDLIVQLKIVWYRLCLNKSCRLYGRTWMPHQTDEHECHTRVLSVRSVVREFVLVRGLTSRTVYYF